MEMVDTICTRMYTINNLQQQHAFSLENCFAESSGFNWNLLAGVVWPYTRWFYWIYRFARDIETNSIDLLEVKARMGSTRDTIVKSYWSNYSRPYEDTMLEEVSVVNKKHVMQSKFKTLINCIINLQLILPYALYKV